MKRSHRRLGKPGYISYLMALSTGVVLSLLMVFTYRRAIAALDVHTVVQMRVDYGEKEDAILRSIVAIAPMRAMQAMKDGSDESETERSPLRWRAIFEDALDMANARSSGQADLMNQLTNPKLIRLNAGDSAFIKAHKIFHPVDYENTNEDDTFITSGLNYDLGTGFPVPLQSSDYDVNQRDQIFPIISSSSIPLAPAKRYGSLAEGIVSLPTSLYYNFNLIPYPKININEEEPDPGQLFVAKRNWWAFEMDMAASGRDEMEAADRKDIKLVAPRRKFVFSIYERPVPPVYAGGGTGLFDYPDSDLSKSGRAALIPIKQDISIFDRFAHVEESDTVSPTKWSDYAAGANQCAMSLDLIDRDPDTNLPTKFRFTAKNSIGQDMTPIVINLPEANDLAADYDACWNDGEAAVDFGSAVVDIAYGRVDGDFTFEYGVSGTIDFNAKTYTDNPNPTAQKIAYSRPSLPFKAVVYDNRGCVEVMPQRMAAYLTRIGAGGLDVNHSLAVNVDYTTSGIASIPDEDNEAELAVFGMLVTECANLSSFPQGFSLVSNLRTYLTQDFNTTAVSPPSGYTPSGSFYPPVSLIVPDIATAPSAINVNLPISHPAEIPPLFLQKWLVTLEEIR